MRLGDLVAALPAMLTPHLSGDSDVVVTGIAFDTRRLRRGDMFCAVREHNGDGHAFIERAVRMGASSVLAENSPTSASSVPVLTVSNSKEAMAYVAAAFHGQPSKRLRLIGVTGTDGKTTTTQLTAQLLNEGGIRTGFMTTVSIDAGDSERDNTSRQSTLEAPDIQEHLAAMRRNGCSTAVVESTSHALALNRLTACSFDTAVVTNVTHEHLDFHGSWENYLNAKAHLLELVATSAEKGGRKAIILNRDDRSFDFLHGRVNVPELNYGLHDRCDVRASSLEALPDGQLFNLSTPWGDAPVFTPLIAPFNVYNCLAAATASLVEGVPLATVITGLSKARPVQGRMEPVDVGQPFRVIVDYAHTPDSLAKVLMVLRASTSGRLLCVFGSAGERDVEKRPEMGAIAAQQADFFVITNEDPRHEDPQGILDAIAAGATSAGARVGVQFVTCVDRSEAIRLAFTQARPGDTVLLAGKGHEQCIIVGDVKVPWSERGVAAGLLRQWYAGTAERPPSSP